MKSTIAFSRPFAWLSLLGFCLISAAGAEPGLVKTNWVERWVTNSIEVRMPLNRFVNEYQTNWVEHTVTNLVKVQATNYLTRTLTNRVVLDRFTTNLMTAYRTNLCLIHLTNLLSVEKFQTNFVNLYRTNWTTLRLTNWETVLVMKTNWVTRPVTNEVQIDLVKSAGPSTEVATSATGLSAVTAKPANPTGSAVATLTDSLTLHAARTTRPPAHGQVEVEFQVSSKSSQGTPVQVEQWRIERDGGAFLAIGHGTQFARELPVGQYQVEVRTEPGEDGRVLVARGTLTVAAQHASIEQRLLARK